MPFKKYREHLIYKRLEKKISTPPPSTSTSLQSVPLESGSASKGINERIHTESSASSSARSSPTGPALNGNLFNGSNSRLNSTRRPLSSLLLTDDEYNAYNYGLVPLSERNIYREFSVIELPNASNSNQMPEKNSSSMNTWSKKTSSLTSDYRHHYHHPHSHNLTVPNGSHATSALKSPPSASSLYSNSNKAGSSSLEREKKTVRIVVEGEDGDSGSRKSPEVAQSSSRSGSASCKSNPFRSSFGRKGGAGARGEVLIPIRREFGSGSGFPRSSSVSSTGSGKKNEHLRVASVGGGSANLAMAMEPVPTPVRSYKCTSYTLNEIRSF